MKLHGKWRDGFKCAFTICEKHGIWDMLLILIKLKIRIVKNKMVKIKNAKN